MQPLLLQLHALQGCGGLQHDLPPGPDPAAPYCYGCCQPLGGSGAQREPQHAQQQPVDAAGGGEVGSIVVRCPDCRSLFCFECDAYIHEQLHNCPGCECLLPQFGGEGSEGGGGDMVDGELG